MRPLHPPLPLDAPIALGYMQVPLLAEPDRIGALMRHRAQSWGYRWGGTHLDHHTGGTIAALARHASREPDVWLIVVPDTTHLPGGRRLLTTATMVIRIVTADTDDGATLHRPTPIPGVSIAALLTRPTGEDTFEGLL
ncbi:hypothetical protein [Nocardia abscessus]|uniref:hypothetical protein n=1 Tax=Nocardia abscessus TaxID=120957 RepID=UPI002454325E|nr:hypothetical protein [Nocardia abscessus]